MDLEKQAHSLADDHNLACKVEMKERLLMIDATAALPLQILGLPINIAWDMDGNLDRKSCGDGK